MAVPLVWGIPAYRPVVCSSRCEQRVRRQRQRETRPMNQCQTCGRGFHGSRRDARFCSSACRQKAYRHRQAKPRTVNTAPVDPAPDDALRLTEVAGSLLLNGTAPNLVVAYALPTDGNIFTIDNGSNIPFPATVVGTNLTATITILNRGSDTGNVQKIQISGDGFGLISTPLVPVAIPSGNNIQFGVRYTPVQAGTNSGTLTIVFDDRTVAISLTGTAIGSLLSYSLLDAQNTPVSPNQTLNFPDTNVGGKNSLTIVAKNASSSPVTVSNLTATGSGFSITDAPIPPISLNPNDTAVITVTFAPTAPGPTTGRLRIANDTFSLSGNAIGSQFVYFYSAGGATTTVTAGQTVVFSPIPVGQTEQVTFTIQNTGTSNATLTSLGVSDPKAPFTVSGPAPPLSLTPNQSVQFILTFAPVTTGLSTATLLADSQQFTLSGLGNTPPPLPSYAFTGASGNQPALTQAGIGLSLSSSYPLPLTGTLALQADSGNLPADPSVQFATGGKTVTFTIPANSTDAVFPGGSTQVKVQTGSIANNITITPTFALGSGLDLTPSQAPSLSLAIPATTVQLQSALITQNSQNTLVLSISGYSTTRAVSALQFQFSPVPSAKLPNSKISVDIQADAASWFNSTQSQSFGGQFTISVPFTLQASNTSSTTVPVSLLQSVSITASDSLGTSKVITLQLSTVQVSQ